MTSGQSLSRRVSAHNASDYANCALTSDVNKGISSDASGAAAVLAECHRVFAMVRLDIFSFSNVRGSQELEDECLQKINVPGRAPVLGMPVLTQPVVPSVRTLTICDIESRSEGPGDAPCGSTQMGMTEFRALTRLGE